ncbi:hypothetical protein [Metabacillus halosaccharovorans]|uniref:hypothetical protein n=1 Tax=Metabacillus halosaccharovorans TaxID=930124 RepID=UPI002040E147|nr:hypothetical protein [Metabacillus halosaccharovorans]MCM3441142.1 hypothetical protein [Metabacillus halosaccharovorans]
MNFSKEDIIIIEQALNAVANSSTDYQELEQYKTVLQKLKNNGKTTQLDGFRYDYDDNM